VAEGAQVDDDTAYIVLMLVAYALVLWGVYEAMVYSLGM
jgi:hypothetical protein